MQQNIDNENNIHCCVLIKYRFHLMLYNSF